MNPENDYAEGEALHHQAMALANDGFALRILREESAALEGFQRAYALEMKAAASAVGLDPSRAILWRSAAGCALHAGLLREAEDAARQALALPGPPGEKHRAGCILASAAVPRWLRSIPVACGATLELPAAYVADALQIDLACVVEVYGETLACPVVDGFASAPKELGSDPEPSEKIEAPP